MTYLEPSEFNWSSNTKLGLVFVDNFSGALTTAFILTYGFNTDDGALVTKMVTIGESRMLVYQTQSAGGWFTLFVRSTVCNWVVSMGVVGAMT